MTSSLSHDGLQADLASDRRRSGYITIEKLGLGAWGGSAQADVVTLRPSWTRPTPTIYEVKVSRADFLQELRSRKFEKYLPWVDRFYFATPRDLIYRKELPPSIGWIVRSENGWHVMKAPRLRSRDPDTWSDLLFAVLLAHQPKPWSLNGRAERIANAKRLTATKDLKFVATERLELCGNIRELLAQGQRAMAKGG